MKLSILIPTIVGREDDCNCLIQCLEKQITDRNKVQIIILKDNKEITIGEKRNKLLEMANGEYVAFIDDDDLVSENYIAVLLEAIESGSDCASLMGELVADGIYDGIFEHSIKYKVWRTNGDMEYVKYERPPNHLNCIKSSIAKQFKFPELKHGEDHVWSMDIQKSGILKTEYYIDQVIYFYNFKTNK